MTKEPKPSAEEQNDAESSGPPRKAQVPTPPDHLPADPEDETTRPRAAFRQGSAPPRHVVEWVAANLNTRPLDVKEAPDSTAWALLHWAIAGPSNMSAFYQMWAKLLPSRAQVEEQDLSDDDGGELLSTIEFVYNAKRLALLRAGTEGRVDEPRVSRGDHPRDDRESE